MLALLLAAEDALPTTSAWWEGTLAWAARIGVVAGALAAVWKIVEKALGRAYEDWQKARQIRRNQALIKTIAANTETVERLERKVDERHRRNVFGLLEVNRSVKQVNEAVKEVHVRIDRHMDEEREQRKEDYAQLMAHLNTVAAMRRDDVQEFREKSERRGDRT